MLLGLGAVTSATGATNPADKAGEGCVSTQAIPDRWIVVLKNSATREQVRAAGAAAADKGGTVHFVYKDAVKGYAATLTADAVAALRKDASIIGIHPDRRNCISSTGDAERADATQTGAPWGLDRIDQRSLPLNGSYTYAATGAGSKVYVIDSGIRATHVDLSGRVAAGVAFNPSTAAGPTAGPAASDDCNGHGTHVAGIIGGETYGVAKDVALIPVRVTDCAGNGTDAATVAGINWVASLPAQARAQAVAAVGINGTSNAAVNAAVAGLVAAGVPVVVAAGNDHVDACTTSPAGEPTAITVASSTKTDARSEFSNFGTCVDIYAPGSGIPSTSSASNAATEVRSGTSMAAAHVAGVVATYLEGVPSATPAAVASALTQNATTGQLSDIEVGSPDRLLFSTLNGTDSAPSVDLSVNKNIPGPTPTAAGTPVTYRLRVRNLSLTDPATGIVLRDTLPADVTAVSTTPSGVCAAPSGGVVTCTLGTLAPGAQTDVFLTLTPQFAGRLDNSATVSGNEFDPVLANNSSTRSVTLTTGPVATANLSVVVNDSPDPTSIGGTLTYTATVTNTGPQTATNVLLTDNLPAGVTFGSATVTGGGTCTQFRGEVSCEVGTIGVNASRTVTVTVTPTAAGSLTNNVLVEADQEDTNEADNAVTTTTTVNAAPPVPTCFGSPATITGNNNANNLIGTPGDDVIVANGGSDYIDGRGGHDKICGGDGGDKIYGGGGDDQIDGGAGRDIIDGEDGNDRVLAGDGDDDVYGYYGNDNLSGQAGADYLFGEGGNDTLSGGTGNDRLFGNAGDDNLDGGADVDDCSGGGGTNSLVNCSP